MILIKNPDSVDEERAEFHTGLDNDKDMIDDLGNALKNGELRWLKSPD